MLKSIGQLWANPALAFRGYNVENLGRTDELLQCQAYEPVMQRWLKWGSTVCSEVLARHVDLEARVRSRDETTLENYAEAVALIYVVEAAQLELLRQFHGVDPLTAELSFGYSLGELVAIAASGLIEDEQALRIPLAMSTDCAALAHDVTMGILFSRASAIDYDHTRLLCEEITAEGDGTVAISAVLSPNTLLLLGQRDTIGKVRRRLRESYGKGVHLRLNDSRWPPLHTPIVWQRSIADRASVMIEQMQISASPSSMPVLSLVTGELVTSQEVRGLLRAWVDHPQRLWDAVTGVLRSPVQTVVHVGPSPNVIPATFSRLSDNVTQIRQAGTLSGLSARAISQLVDRRWLSTLLPASASLLRAPVLRHIMLEDWLLEHSPTS